MSFVSNPIVITGKKGGFKKMNYVIQMAKRMVEQDNSIKLERVL